MSSSTVTRRPASGTLAEVVDILLDKGLVIDAYIRVSLVGIELLTIDIRIVLASVDTYLHFAEATNRLDLRGQAEEHDADLQDLVGGMAGAKTSGALDAAGDRVSGAFDDAKDRSGGALASGREKVKAVFGRGDDDAEGAEEQDADEGEDDEEQES